jgi:hypothetical protein
MIKRLAFYILDSNTYNINLDMTYNSKIGYRWQKNMKMPSIFSQSKYCSTKKSLYYTLNSVNPVSRALIHKSIKSVPRISWIRV